MILTALALAAATPLPPPQLWRDKENKCLYMLYALPKGRYRAEMLPMCDMSGPVKNTCPQTILFTPPSKKKR